MADADELYTVKNNFWLGNFQDAIEEAKSLRLRADAARMERDILIYRSYIGLQNFRVVLSEIKEESNSLPLIAVRRFAQYLSDPAAKPRVMAALESTLTDVAAASDSTVLTLAATIYLSEGQFSTVLRILKGSTVLEHLALLAQAFLRLDRPDLTEQVVKQMQTIDDESALTSVSAGLLNLTKGGPHIKEASMVYKELLDRFGRSNAGLNGLATAYIAMKKYDEAERTLADALEGNPDDPDTLANVVTLQVQSGSVGKKFQETLAKLKSVAPHHPYVESLSRAEDMFDRVSSTFGV